MKKPLSKRIKWIFLSIVMVSLVIFSHDIYFKYVINDYQVQQIEKEIQENYDKHQNKFQELIRFSQELGNIELFEFAENKLVTFQILDSTFDASNFNSSYLNIGEGSSADCEDVNFLQGDSIEISSGNYKLVSHNWRLEFQGKLDNLVAKKILAYKKANPADLRLLQQKLEEVNCSGFQKNDSLINFRFIGHRDENFQYNFPLKPILNKKGWNKLDDQLYWSHYQNGLYCGLTDY